MTAEPQDEEGGSGLYVTDAEIIHRLGYGDKCGRRILASIQNLASFRPYPPKDRLFAGRRFWPAVEQWHMDYHRVRGAEQKATTTQHGWQENFDGSSETGKTGRHERARPELARTQ